MTHTDIATLTPREFRRALGARGMWLHVRNNRLRIWPPDLYPTLTDAEHAFIREHRQALKDDCDAQPDHDL